MIKKKKKFVRAMKVNILFFKYKDLNIILESIKIRILKIVNYKKIIYN